MIFHPLIFFKRYTCPRGHPYSVGNCGRPMMIGRCHCGAPIGGEHHQTLSGTSKTDSINQDLFLTKGYSYSKADVVPGVPDEVKVFLRFLTHICLFISLQIGTAKKLPTFLFHSQEKTIKDCQERLYFVAHFPLFFSL